MARVSAAGGFRVVSSSPITDRQEHLNPISLGPFGSDNETNQEVSRRVTWGIPGMRLMFRFRARLHPPHHVTDPTVPTRRLINPRGCSRSSYPMIVSLVSRLCNILPLEHRCAAPSMAFFANYLVASLGSQWCNITREWQGVSPVHLNH